MRLNFKLSEKVVEYIQQEIFERYKALNSLVMINVGFAQARPNNAIRDDTNNADDNKFVSRGHQLIDHHVVNYLIVVYHSQPQMMVRH